MNPIEARVALAINAIGAAEGRIDPLKSRKQLITARTNTTPPSGNHWANVEYP